MNIIYIPYYISRNDSSSNIYIAININVLLHSPSTPTSSLQTLLTCMFLYLQKNLIHRVFVISKIGEGGSNRVEVGSM